MSTTAADRITIRHARRQEAAAIATLAAATFPLACPPGSDHADIEAFISANLTPEHFAVHLANPGHIVLVADAEGTLVGYSLLIVGEPLEPALAAVLPGVTGLAYLSKCYLLPDRHGSGISGQLMSVTVDAARTVGASGVCLGVNAENTRAQGFYRRSGFTVAGERSFQVGAQTHHDLVLVHTF